MVLNTRVPYIILSACLLFLFVNIPTSFASHKTFQDNFNDDSADDWIVTRNTCRYNGSPSQWQVVNSKLGMKINGGSCISEIVPSDSVWNNLGNDYSFEFDMNLVSGTDHNFGFRFLDTAHLFDVHIQSPNKLILQLVANTNKYTNTVNGDFSNNQTIRFKVDIVGSHIKVYKGTPPTLILDYPDAGNNAPSGKIALQASAGGDPSSETYFDNIVVTSIDDITPTLNVPLLKQTSDPWQSQIYDSANVWSPSTPTINSWGCALTSVAMVFKYYGLNLLPGNIPVDPGSLNNWLKSQNGGYVNGGHVNWEAFTRLSKIAVIVNNIVGFDSLEFRRIDGTNNEQLVTDITEARPDILQVPGHFVVAKGASGSAIFINDPYHDRTDLSQYNNTYEALVRYIPSFTDLSYIMLVVDPSITIELKDSNGNTIGDSFIQNPISNPLNPSQTSGDPIRIVYVPAPSSGKYTIDVSGNTTKPYQVQTFLYDINGEVAVGTGSGILQIGTPDSLEIQFDKDSNGGSKTEKITTFESTIADINNAKTLRLIQAPLATTLVNQIKSAQKERSGKNKNTGKLLNKFETTLQKSLKNTKKGIQITQEAYNILFSDAEYLKTH